MTDTVTEAAPTKRSEKAGVAGQEAPEFASYRCAASALYAMADLNPPPPSHATNTKSEAADSGGVIITHGEAHRPAVGPETASCDIHLRADSDPDLTDSQKPTLPDHKPKKWV